MEDGVEMESHNYIFYMDCLELKVAVFLIGSLVV